MSGIRQTREVSCPECGATGVVEFGMAMLGGLNDEKDFDCVRCGSAISVTGQRAILNLKWDNLTPAQGAESGRSVLSG